MSTAGDAQSPAFAAAPLLIAFTNFTRYTAQADGLEDVDVARVMARYYDFAGSRITAAGGRVVKFMGDGALAVFPADRAEVGVLALLDLKEASDRFMAEQGWECRLLVRVHFGTAVAGQFGPGADKRYDVLGKAVNVAARLDGGAVVLSDEAFGRLGPDTQQRFKKHTLPNTYIRQEDQPRPRWARGA